MKKVVSLLLCLVMLFSITIPTFAAERPIRIKLCNYTDTSGHWVGEKWEISKNDVKAFKKANPKAQYIISDTAPEIINNRTMIPLRIVAEELGYNVYWKPGNGKINDVHLEKSVSLNSYKNYNQMSRIENLFYNLEAGNKIMPKSIDSPNALNELYKRDNKKFNDIVSKNQFFCYDTWLPAGQSIKNLMNSGKTLSVYISFDVYEGKHEDKPNWYIDYGEVGIYTDGDTGNNHSFYNSWCKYYIDSKAVIRNGRTLIPLRAMCEMMGLTVGWDNNNRIVTISA